MKSAHEDVAQKYIAYRNQHNIACKAKIRDVSLNVVDIKNSNVIHENTDMNADTSAGIMMKLASKTAKSFAGDHLLSE